MYGMVWYGMAVSEYLETDDGGAATVDVRTISRSQEPVASSQ